MSKTIYLTTPLYYVNAAPHIGHSYTNIAADALTRYHRLRGESVFLLTGTDEHGQKIERAASSSGMNPKDYTDKLVAQFTSLWRTLNISYDDFIRTTQQRHILAVQSILGKLHDAGKLKRASYKGWYCTPDETFWTEGEIGLEALSSKAPLCPSCQRPLEVTQEEGWYLQLRAQQPWLKSFVDSHPTFVQPKIRYNELLSLLEEPLPEYLCITRPRSRVSWGIEVPFSTEHVVYVWFDALLNYITAAGYESRELKARERFSSLWPADVHFIGKDILRHHAVYWPIMLHAMGFPDDEMPKTIFAHGWWKIGEQKMSKSLGNIVDPAVVVERVLENQPYAADIYRYFLLREIPFGQDGSFSEDAIMSRLSSDLANDLGNLVNRTLSMIERYRSGKIPSAPIDKPDAVSAGPELAKAMMALTGEIERAMAHLEFSLLLESIMQRVSQANRYIELAAPWTLAKHPERAQQLDIVLSTLSEAIRITAIALDPLMPSVSDAIWHQLGFDKQSRRFEDMARWPGLSAGQQIGRHPVLFPRNDAAPE